MTTEELVQYAYGLHIRSRYIFSEKPITEIRAAKKQCVGIKPSGLWYSWGGNWAAMLWEHHQRWPDDGWRLVWLQRMKYVYKIRPDYSRVLRLRQLADLRKFEKMYGRNVEFTDGIVHLPDKYIDWRRVAKDYQGIDIRYRSRWDIMGSWYDGWDISSGCIWCPDAVKHLELVLEV